ncbi:hypothetical protein FEDK69T_17620 [Flavobacterium enshiense DK69]|uniref:Polyketide cyclase n=1 Tax=Flavobacterium enshiense DK69 TaxID=1107311 RepID=V6S8U5_9FLAO|nr:SRPBCC family protein [Flavobacterium enshiense]ESU22859.1 hypothetical protein FEDK69T_17620 [Flavobacterium enshiense DK69]KGO93991.1 polyketide cyclase [Flavobacterium enshiense DK69]
MATNERITITVTTSVNAPVDKVWKFWTRPEHITQWNNASDDWHTPQATNDLRPKGKFIYRMEAKDGTFGFDFRGIYSNIKINELIEYAISDGRKVRISFEANENLTTVTETFEPEEVNSLEMQQSGWQAILDNFKKYTESN